jgi:hypothetical protein
MTQVICKFYDSEDNPLVGSVWVKLDGTLQNSTDTATYLPVVSKTPLVNGGCTLNLEPSDISKVTYLIEVYTKQTLTIEDENGDPVSAEVDTLVDSYSVIIPFSATPITLESLQRKTGIDRDRTDTMIPAVVRRMSTSSEFWQLLQQELFPFKGTYNPLSYYRKGNLVEYDGSGWICISNEPIQGIVPVTGSPSWGLWVSRGQQGSGVTGNDTAYSVAWNGSTDVATRNAIYDKIEALVAQLASTYVGINSPNFTGAPTLATAPASNDRSSKLVSSQWVGTLYDDAKNSGLRVGSLMLFPSASRPLGFIKCGTGAPSLDVSQTTYSQLFAIYGTTFGTSTAGNFKLPSAAQLPTLPSTTLSWYVFTGRND